MGVAWNALDIERDMEQFVDLGGIQRVFVSGLAYCRIIDGLFHGIYFVRRPNGLRVQEILELELIMPSFEIPAHRRLTNAAMSEAKLLLQS